MCRSHSDPGSYRGRQSSSTPDLHGVRYLYRLHSGQFDASTIDITVRLLEKQGDVTKVVANPTIRANEGRPFAFMAGAEVEGTSPLLEYGTRIEGSVSTTNTKALAVALTLTKGQLIDSGDPRTKTVRALTLDMRTELPSVTRTIQIDDKTSIEVTIHD